MTKKTGFNIRIDAFVEIDKKDFGKQAAAFAMMDTITKTGKLPDGFFDQAQIVKITGKAGAAELPDTAANADEPVLPSVVEADKKNAKPE